MREPLNDHEDQRASPCPATPCFRQLLHLKLTRTGNQQGTAWRVATQFEPGSRGDATEDGMFAAVFFLLAKVFS
jgi:hypothetical protein